MTNAATSVPVSGNAAYLAVNPVTNKIYAAGTNLVTVIDGATNSTTTIPANGYGCAVAINPVTNKTYVGFQQGDGTVMVIGTPIRS